MRSKENLKTHWLFFFNFYFILFYFYALLRFCIFGRGDLTKSGLNFLTLLWIECMRGSVFFGWNLRETVLCIWLTSLVVLKSVVRNPQEVLHIYLTDVWVANLINEKRAPIHPPALQFFSRVSFASWALGIGASTPHSLLPLWLYNELYLNINYLWIWFYPNSTE